jgi:hypothetical protein
MGPRIWHRPLGTARRRASHLENGGHRRPRRSGAWGGPSAGESPASGTDSLATIANGATVDIDGPSAQTVTFAGTTGTLKLEEPQAFTGVVSGLSGTDAIDLSGFAYGANATAT